MKRYTYTTDGVGVYGEQTKDYNYSNDITVDFQNESNTEIAKQYGVEKGNLYKIYLPLDVELLDTDLLIDPDGNEYLIIGEVKRYDHYHNYIKAHLVHVRGKLTCQ
jgi:hypothetical protein